MSGHIHKDWTVCSKSQLDLFLIPPTQTAIKRGHSVKYHPIADIRDGGPVEFNFSGNGEQYINLSASHLHVKVEIIKSDGTSLPDKEPVAPVNLFSLVK